MNVQLRIRGTASEGYCTKKEKEKHIGGKTEKASNEFSYIFSKSYTLMQKDGTNFNMSPREERIG